MFSHFTESSWWRSSYSHYPPFSDTLSVSAEGTNASFPRGSGMDLTPSSAGTRNFKDLLPSYGPGQYSCDKCGKVGFDTVLLTHYTFSVLLKQLLIEIHLSQVYRWKCNLTTHQRLECGQEPRFVCPVCPHRSKFRGNIYKHVLSRHPEVDAESFRREQHLRHQLLLRQEESLKQLHQ